VTLKDTFEAAFKSPRFSAAMLIVTAVFLMLTKFIQNRQQPLTIGRGFLIGCAQAVDILPGISRSGSTISAGMFMGIAPAEAAEFSFLLSIPAVGGAFLIDMISAGKEFLPTQSAGLYLMGALISFVFVILAIHYLIKIVRHGRFFFFGFYCLVVGALALIFLS
jgi:undecaprenyl-diphosphatase